MPNCHVVSGKYELLLFGFPNGGGPVADNLIEAIGSPTVECSSDDGHISRVSAQVTPKPRQQFFAIIKSAVPRDDEALVRPIRLMLRPCLSSSVEGSIRQSDRTIYVVRLPVGALLR